MYIGRYIFSKTLLVPLNTFLNVWTFYVAVRASWIARVRCFYWWLQIKPGLSRYTVVNSSIFTNCTCCIPRITAIGCIVKLRSIWPTWRRGSRRWLFHYPRNSKNTFIIARSDQWSAAHCHNMFSAATCTFIGLRSWCFTRRSFVAKRTNAFLSFVMTR